MDSSVSLKDQIWFMRVCHHVSNVLYSEALTTICASLAYNGTDMKVWKQKRNCHLHLLPSAFMPRLKLRKQVSQQPWYVPTKPHGVTAVRRKLHAHNCKKARSLRDASLFLTRVLRHCTENCHCLTTSYSRLTCRSSC